MLLVTDLDCTLTMENEALQKHPEAIASSVDPATADFNTKWLRMKRHHPDAVLCYSTGRSLELFEDLVKVQRERTRDAFECGPLLAPDVIITADGTTIHWRQDDGALLHDLEWERILASNWDVAAVREIFRKSAIVRENGVDLEKYFARKEKFRMSVVIEGEAPAKQAVDEIQTAIDTHNGGSIDAEVFICTHTSGGSQEKPQFWLVATPISGGKGNALDYVRRRVGADPSRTLAAGDSGNDAPMFDSKNAVEYVVSLLEMQSQSLSTGQRRTTKTRKALGMSFQKNMPPPPSSTL